MRHQQIGESPSDDHSEHEAMEYEVSRERLPGGQSWPFKRREIDEALAEAAPHDVSYIAFARMRRTGHSDRVVYADFAAEGASRFASGGSVLLWIFAVSSNQRNEIWEKMKGEALPALIEWLKDLKESENVRRSFEQRFSADFSNGVMTVSKT